MRVFFSLVEDDLFFHCDEDKQSGRDAAGLLHHALKLRSVNVDTLGIVEDEEDLLKIARRCLPEVFRQGSEDRLRCGLLRKAGTGKNDEGENC